MREEVAAEQRVVLGLDGAALPRPFDTFRAPAAGAVQGQPAPARFQPAPDRAALPGIGIRARHVRDQEPAERQPLRDVREVVGDRRRDIPLCQETEEAETGVVMVVPGVRSGRKPSDDEMRARRCRVCHRITSVWSRPGEHSEQPGKSLVKFRRGSGTDREHPSVASGVIERCDPLSDGERFIQGVHRAYSCFAPFGQVCVHQRFTVRRNAPGGAAPQEDQQIEKRMRSCAVGPVEDHRRRIEGGNDDVVGVEVAVDERGGKVSPPGVRYGLGRKQIELVSQCFEAAGRAPTLLSQPGFPADAVDLNTRQRPNRGHPGVH